jgi:O-glycosyl hydrolase
LLFKREVGVEPTLFSFNESNLGINVLMSPEEHRDAIKILGAHFESIGLKTKLLLADANEPRAVEYPLPALVDAEAMRYVGMVSYHSWNGGTDQQLIAWRDHARRANLPLTVAEAGHDPDAHQYRAVLTEPWYAMEEIENYLRCMTLSQPESVLHWQLTGDYGFLTEDLQPTRRWWQFKQLADLSPRGARHLLTKCDRRDITIAALGDEGGIASVIHIGNTAAARTIALSGLSDPAYRIILTDASRAMSEVGRLETKAGRAELNLPAQSFVTLVRE